MEIKQSDIFFCEHCQKYYEAVYDNFMYYDLCPECESEGKEAYICEECGEYYHIDDGNGICCEPNLGL